MRHLSKGLTLQNRLSLSHGAQQFWEPCFLQPESQGEDSVDQSPQMAHGGHVAESENKPGLFGARVSEALLLQHYVARPGGRGGAVYRGMITKRAV